MAKNSFINLLEIIFKNEKKKSEIFKQFHEKLCIFHKKLAIFQSKMVGYLSDSIVRFVSSTGIYPTPNTVSALLKGRRSI